MMTDRKTQQEAQSENSRPVPAVAGLGRGQQTETCYFVRYRSSRLNSGSALTMIMEQLVTLSVKSYGRVQMGLAEVLNNIAEHGASGHPPPCTVEILGDSKHLCCVIRDSGRAAPLIFYMHKPREQEDAFADIQLLPERGYGRQIIHACFDRIQYHATPEENLLMLEMDLLVCH